jgi:hypothetical protein
MFAPDVEARFKRIEDAHIVAAELLKETREAQIVAAELLRRFEIKTDERIGHLEAIQNAMASWMDKMADQQTGHEARMAEHEARMAEHEARMADLDVKIAALVDAQMETEKALGDLSRTVDRYLRSRSNGGTA